MQRYQTEIANLRYNAASQQFEALVIFHEGTDRTAFPCEISAPITMDFATISHKLVVLAKIRRARGSRDMVSRLYQIAADPAATRLAA